MTDLNQNRQSLDSNQSKQPTLSANFSGGPSIHHLAVGSGFGVRNDASQQAVRAGPQLRLVVQGPRERGVGVAPRPLDLVHPEAVAADVVAQVHGVLDEERVEPVPRGEQGQGRREAQRAE